jgi:hypothetical protein
MTHPVLMAAVAQQRSAELRRLGAARRAAAPSRVPSARRQPSRARRRAGWWLVTFGLRLAVGPTTVPR